MSCMTSQDLHSPYSATEAPSRDSVQNAATVSAVERLCALIDGLCVALLAEVAPRTRFGGWLEAVFGGLARPVTRPLIERLCATLREMGDRMRAIAADGDTPRLVDACEQTVARRRDAQSGLSVRGGAPRRPGIAACALPPTEADIGAAPSTIGGPDQPTLEAGSAMRCRPIYSVPCLPLRDRAEIDRPPAYLGGAAVVFFEPARSAVPWLAYFVAIP